MSCVLIIVLDVNHLVMGDFLAKIIQPSMHDSPTNTINEETCSWYYVVNDANKRNHTGMLHVGKELNFFQNASF